MWNYSEWKVDERKKWKIGKYEGDFPFTSDEIWVWWLPEIGLLIGGLYKFPNWESEEAVWSSKVCLMLNNSREAERKSTVSQLVRLICSMLQWAKGGSRFQNICTLWGDINVETTEFVLTQIHIQSIPPSWTSAASEQFWVYSFIYLFFII